MICNRSGIKPNVINKVATDSEELLLATLGVIIDHKLNWIEYISHLKTIFDVSICKLDNI